MRNVLSKRQARRKTRTQSHGSKAVHEQSHDRQAAESESNIRRVGLGAFIEEKEYTEWHSETFMREPQSEVGFYLQSWFSYLLILFPGLHGGRVKSYRLISQTL